MNRNLKLLLTSFTLIGSIVYAASVYADQFDGLRDAVQEPIRSAPAPAPIQPDPPAPEPVYAPAPAPAREPVYAPSAPAPISRPRPRPVIRKLPTVRKLDFAYVQSGVLGEGDPISSNRYYHTYTFQGKADQPVELRLVGSNDSRLKLTPAMFLFGPKGKEPLGRRFSEIDAVRSSFMFMRLPDDGTYSVIVTSKDPKAIGRYSLALRDDRASYLLDRFGDLSDRSPKLRQDNRAFEAVEFRGRRDQFINIRVDSVRAEFLPLVYLLNSKGKVIATSRDDNNLYRITIERSQLPEDDTYRIIVSSVRPEGRGRFRVSVF